MFLLPMLVAVGALACLAGSRASRPRGVVTGGHRRRVGPAPSAILMEYARLGRRPPPQLVSSALAEAQHGGHDELVRAIVEVYVRPVVEASERSAAWEYLPAPAVPPVLPA